MRQPRFSIALPAFAAPLPFSKNAQLIVWDYLLLLSAFPQYFLLGAGFKIKA